MQIDRYQIHLYGNTQARKALVLTIEEHGEGAELFEECKNLCVEDFVLAGISGISWEDDLSPWPAPPTFKKALPFGGKAGLFLKDIVEQILPRILSQLETKPKHIIFAGYSLAGLFGVYSAYNTDAFDGIISASGSMWYPDFMSYTDTHTISPKVKFMYFSVGDKEANTKNAVMKPVEENTRIIAEKLEKFGVKTIFELNPGGHFVDDAKRTAKGIAWVIKNMLNEV